jgi:hypothetical protein
VLLEEGRPAIRTTYIDGGQHPVFLALSRRGASLGEVSRPEALAAAGKEIVIAAARPLKPTVPAQGRAEAGGAPDSTDPGQGGLLVGAALAGGSPPLPEQEPSFLTPVRLPGFRALGLQMPQLAGSVRIMPPELFVGL